jgi:hypothetical protein
VALVEGGGAASPHRARWALATLVDLRRARSARLTVTMRLYPGDRHAAPARRLGLLALLAIQAEALRAARARALARAAARPLGGARLTVVQAALGGWVSSNYAVLACSDFPTCQGSWWPEMTLATASSCPAARRERAAAILPFAALTAIHMAHRIGALGPLPALALLRGGCMRRRRDGAPWASAARHRRMADGERARQRAARLAARRGGGAHRRRAALVVVSHAADRARARRDARQCWPRTPLAS